MIQIRPAAVQKQINEKTSSMKSLSEECERLQEAARNFVKDASLQGSGWGAAKERVGAYDKLFSAIIYAYGLISMGDSTVFNALNSRFGRLEAANEEEWLQMQSEAQALYDAAEQDFNDAYDPEHPSADQAAKLQDASERMGTNLEKLNRAGAMLSKIYSYCEETNHVYEGDELSGYRDAIAHGVSALTGSAFDPATSSWHDWDDGWTDELNHAAENTRPSEPMNADGTVNTQSVQRDMCIMRSFPEDSQQYQDAKARLEAALAEIMAMDPDERRAALAALAQSGLVTGSRDEDGYLTPQCSDELGEILDGTGVSWDVLLAAAGYDENDEGSDMSNAFTEVGSYYGMLEGAFEYLDGDIPQLHTLARTINAAFITGDAILSAEDEYKDDFWLDERSRRIESTTEGVERAGIDGTGVVLAATIGGIVGGAVGSVPSLGLGTAVGTAVGTGVGLIYGIVMSCGGSNVTHGATADTVRSGITYLYDQVADWPGWRGVYNA